MWKTKTKRQKRIKPHTNRIMKKQKKNGMMLKKNLQRLRKTNPNSLQDNMKRPGNGEMQQKKTTRI